ncbi:MAG: glycosyltransferase [Gammaproteobacteria bacterium]|nr:glycosyltransferase [Gammaproteobacteria bacterium]|tara:strand:+ start:349 stop:1302 length:954 start_codon:yes stop_codon:yes gene_type:complete
MINNKKLISIISPCYNEGVAIYDCYEAIKKIFSEKLIDYSYEHIFCDNSSKDNSSKILRELAEKDKRVKIIFNGNNFGSQKSIWNSLKYTSGDAVIMFLPIDLQDPPELIIDFVKNWEKGFDFVYGTRDSRQESLTMRTTRKLFYKLINLGSSNKIPMNISDYQLVDKKIIKEMLDINDLTPFIRTIPFFKTDNHKKLSYEWKRRKIGKSKTLFGTLFDTAMNGLVSVTNAPFRLILVSGFILSVLSIFYAFYNFIYLFFFRPDIERGIPLLIVALFFFSGVQLLVMGFLGEYLSSIHNQVRNKDKVYVKETINFDD